MAVLGEGVGLDDVGAGGEIFAMDRADDVRTRDHQQVAVPLLLARVILELRAAEVRFGQLVALDHRAHRAVQHEQTLRQLLVQSRHYRGARCAMRGAQIGAGGCAGWGLRDCVQWT